MTGTSKVPLQGFAALEGMNGIQKFQIHRDDRSTDRLPSAHTWYGAGGTFFGARGVGGGHGRDGSDIRATTMVTLLCVSPPKK